jgi:hypothetical protein
MKFRLLKLSAMVSVCAASSACVVAPVTPVAYRMAPVYVRAAPVVMYPAPLYVRPRYYPYY